MMDFENQSLEELILTSVPLIARTVDAALRQKQPNLSPVHFGLLNFLRPGQALPQNELAELFQVSPSTFSATVETLVKRGWLQRLPAEKDRRITLISITPTGREVLEEVHQEILSALIKITENLNEEEKSQVKTGLTILRQAFVQNLMKEGITGLPVPPPAPGDMPFPPPPFGLPFKK